MAEQTEGAQPVVPVRERTRPVAPAPAPAPSPEAAAPSGSSLSDVMQQVAKTHGANVMRRASTALTVIPHLSTGIFTLDMALFGGVPQSMITMPYGWESSGKTTVAMRVVAAAQRKYPDKTAVFIDVEGTFDRSWAQRHGIDIDRLIIVQPETGEQAVDISDAVIRAHDTSIVVMDSLPALVPIKELEKSAEDAIVALQARLVGTLVRKAKQALLDERKKGHTPTLLLINQWRSKITMMGDPRSLPGGNALKFFTDVRFEVMNKEHLGKDGFDIETVEHNEHSFKITKNKIGTGIRTGEFTMIRNPSNPLGPGFIDDGKTVLTYAKKLGVFSGGGSSWRIDGVDTRFGKISEAVDWLYEHPTEFDALKRRLISIHRRNCGLQTEGWF
jgi:recombination protein RecA